MKIPQDVLDSILASKFTRDRKMVEALMLLHRQLIMEIALLSALLETSALPDTPEKWKQMRAVVLGKSKTN